MSETLPICPTCGKSVVKHCENRGCDLVECRACHLIHVPGTRWGWRRHPHYTATPDK